MARSGRIFIYTFGKRRIDFQSDAMRKKRKEKKRNNYKEGRRKEGREEEREEGNKLLGIYSLFSVLKFVGIEDTIKE